MFKGTKKPWGGGFSEGTEPLVEDYTSSVNFDSRLYRADIYGSIAHTKMLAKQRIIPKKDSKKIIRALRDIEQEIEKGIFKPDKRFEDIHMNIEKRLVEKTGMAGKRLHTARSRNDQVALDLRLFLKEEIGQIRNLIRSLQATIIKICKNHIDTILPGYTHLQRAQPLLLAHHLLAYFEMLQRDMGRFNASYKAADAMPLGAGALAGTSLPIDRRYVAKLLGFTEITRNSIDSVSDRDFALDFLYSCAVLMMHLSRLSEELVLWCTSEFGFAELPDRYATGSSMMPQKKNPDVLELIRGKSGRTYGNLLRLFVIMKGLPLAYNRDMQEDKEAVFDSADTVRESLRIMIALLSGIRFNADRMRAACNGFITATEIAEYLVKKGVPFREAHSVVGSLLRYCSRKRKDLNDLSLSEFKKFSKYFANDVINAISPVSSVNSKNSEGGTSRSRVMSQIKKAEKILKK